MQRDLLCLQTTSRAAPSRAWAVVPSQAESCSPKQHGAIWQSSRTLAELEGLQWTLLFIGMDVAIRKHSLSHCLSPCTGSSLRILCLEVSRQDNFNLKDKAATLIPGWSVNRWWLQLPHPAHHSWWQDKILMLKLSMMRLYVTGHTKETATDGLEN